MKGMDGGSEDIGNAPTPRANDDFPINTITENRELEVNNETQEMIM